VPSPLPFYLAVILGRYLKEKTCTLALLERRNMFKTEEESSSSMQNIMSKKQTMKKRRRFPVETPRKQSIERVRKNTCLLSTLPPLII